MLQAIAQKQLSFSSIKHINKIIYLLGLKMNINDLFNAQTQLDEGPVGDVLAKGARGLAKGAGAVVGGLAGMGAAAKQGYQAGKAAVGGKPVADTASVTPPLNPEQQQQISQGADVFHLNPPLTPQQLQQVQQPTQVAPQATAPRAQVSPQAQQQIQAAKVGVGQINKIIPTLRTRDLQSVKKTIDATIAQKQPAAAAPSGALDQMASQLSKGGASSTGGQVTATPTGIKHTAAKPTLNIQQAAEGYSRFLGIKL